jgi:hypothetical protein
MVAGKTVVYGPAVHALGRPTAINVVLGDDISIKHLLTYSVKIC